MNIPNLPDNLHKALFIIGLIFIGFAYYKYDQNILNLEKEAEKVNEMSNETYFQKNKVIDLEYSFKISCWEESLRLKIENFCMNDKDGDLEFYRILDGNNEIKRVSDSLSQLWNNILQERSIRDNLMDKTEFAVDDLNYAIELTNESNVFNFSFGIFGGLILFIGLGRWWQIQNIQDQILLSSIPKKNVYKFCESCGRNFSFRVIHGHDALNNKSNKFCSDCYINGEFTDFVNEELIAQTKKRLINNCNDKIKKRNLTKRFDNLLRWNQSDYE